MEGEREGWVWTGEGLEWWVRDGVGCWVRVWSGG